MHMYLSSKNIQLMGRLNLHAILSEIAQGISRILSLKWQP